MEFGISDQARDIVVLQQRVGEDLGRGEAGCVQSNVAVKGWWTNGNSAIDVAQSEICSRWASKSAMTDMSCVCVCAESVCWGTAGAGCKQSWPLGAR
jgi:hypothetical protein